MPSSYTPSLRLTLPVTGELSGTWGDTVNAGITTLVDSSIAGYVVVAMTDADYTLTVANGATDESRRMILSITGTLTAARNVICPTASKIYFIRNNTTGGFAITIKTSAGTGISVPNGTSALVACDGTNVTSGVGYIPTLSLGAALPVLSGGTGVTTSTGSGANVLGTSPALVTPSYTGSLTGDTGIVNLGSGQFYKDASGNVGIGVSSPVSKLHVNSAGTPATYATVGNANNGIAVGVGPSGVGRLGTYSGNAGIEFGYGSSATWTPTMVLDSSGNVGIGTISPDIFGTGTSRQFGINSAGGNTFSMNAAAGQSPYILLGIAGARTASFFSSSSANFLQSDNANPLAFATGGVERMRIDSSGNVGIGTTNTVGFKTAIANAATSQVLILTSGVAGAFANFSDSSATNSPQVGGIGNSLVANTSGIERMRIDPSGNLLVGTTTAAGSSAHNLWNSLANTSCLYLSSTNASSPNGILVKYPNAAPNGIANEFLYCLDNAAIRASIRSNGGLANYSANNVNLSDERTKTAIQDAGGYLAKICAIPVRTFLYKDQTDSTLNLGVIAQEVEAVAPELVDISGFGETPADGIPLKAIYQTDLQYALMRCIQEQQEIIEALTVRLTILEAKGA